MLPFEAGIERGTEEAARELTVAGVSRPAQPWTLRLFPQGLRLTPQREGEASIHTLRSEIATHVELVNFGVTRHTLVVRKPKRRVFKLDPAAWAELLAWVGHDARLRIALRQRLGYGIPVGILVLISSLPVPGNPEAGIEGFAFNPLFAVLGVLLIAGAILARRRPHPALFLLDSAWFAVLAGTLVWRVIHGGSPLWLILVVLQLLLVWSGVSLFRDLRTPPKD
jgi:hypothetical protein